MAKDSMEAQHAKFVTAARELDSDDSEEAFNAKLKRVAMARSKEGRATDPKTDRQPD